MSPKPLDWQRNIWTGTDSARVSNAGRILRLTFHNPDGYLYWAEWWGTYGREYPKRGDNRKTLAEALRDLRKLEKQYPLPEAP